MNVNEIHAHPRDARLLFDEQQHIYTCDGRQLMSVTTLVESYFEQFDAEYWAERKATPFRPKEAILAEWAAKGKIARDLGTQMHARIEKYYLGENDGSEYASDDTFSRFLQFAGGIRLTPYRTEWRIYAEEYGLAGTLDFLAMNDRGEYEIWDWKRSSKLVDAASGDVIDYNRYGKHAFAPICHIPDTTFHHYALQVSVYRYILEHKYGIRPVAGHLGVFHPDYSTYYIVDVPYLEDEVHEILSQLR